MFGELSEAEIAEDQLLQDEDIFETPLIEREVPTLREDVRIIASLEAEVQSIQYILQDISRQTGVSQTIALEAMRFCEDLQKTPLNHFTKHASATKLQITQESLFAAIRKKFREIYQAIREWIRRCVKWFSGLREKGSDRDYEVAKQKLMVNENNANLAWDTAFLAFEQLRTTITAVNQETAFTRHLVREGALPDVSQLVLRILEQRPQHSLNQVLQSQDPFLADVVDLGPFTRLTRDIAQQFPILLSQILTRLARVEGALHAELTAEPDTFARQERLRLLKEAAQPVTIVIQGRTTSLMDLLSRVAQTSTQINQQGASEPIAYEDLVTRVMVNTRELDVRQMNHLTYKGLQDLVVLEEKIAAMEAQESRMEYGDYWSQGNDQFVSQFRQTLFLLSSEVNRVIVLLRYAKMTVDRLFFISRDLTHYNEILLDWLITEGKKQGLTVPASIAQQVAAMNRRRNANYTRFKQYTAGNQR